MSDSAVTRVSLLVRVRDIRDQGAWEEFVELYAPLVYRYARRWGLQEADAADVTQDVLQIAARTMPAFEYEPQRGRFRGWLLTVAGNALRKFLAARHRQPTGSGDSGLHRLLSEQPADDADREFWEREYRERLFAWALERVRHQFRERTWRAFERTAIEDRPVAEVAAELGLSPGAVYIARTRVLARIKEEITQRLGEDF